MNWLREKIILLVIVVSVIALPFTGMPLVFGTLVLIGVTALLMTASDAGFNRTVHSARRFSCPRAYSLQTLFAELQTADLGAWRIRMSGIRGIRSEAIVLESDGCPDYFYIYKGHFGRKIYLATSTLRSYIRDTVPDRKRDAAVAASLLLTQAEWDGDTAAFSDRLYCACRNIVETGRVGFEPTAQMLLEEDDTPPALFRIPILHAAAVREYFASRDLRGLQLLLRGLALGLLTTAGLFVRFPNEMLTGAYDALLLFVLFPLAGGLVVWGAIRQVRDWWRR